MDPTRRTSDATGIRILAISNLESCGVCGDSLRIGAVTFCLACERGIHRDCLDYARACPTFGCRGALPASTSPIPVRLPRGAAMSPGSGGWQKIPADGSTWRDLSDRSAVPDRAALGLAAGELAQGLMLLGSVGFALPFFAVPWFLALEYFLGTKAAALVLVGLGGFALRRFLVLLAG